MHIEVHGFQPYAHLWWVLECVFVLYACASALCSHAVVHTHTHRHHLLPWPSLSVGRARGRENGWREIKSAAGVT